MRWPRDWVRLYRHGQWLNVQRMPSLNRTHVLLLSFVIVAFGFLFFRWSKNRPLESGLASKSTCTRAQLLKFYFSNVDRPLESTSYDMNSHPILKSIQEAYHFEKFEADKDLLRSSTTVKADPYLNFHHVSHAIAQKYLAHEISEIPFQTQYLLEKDAPFSCGGMLIRTQGALYLIVEESRGHLAPSEVSLFVKW